MWSLLILVPALLAVMAWWLSRWGFVPTRAYLDGLAPDHAVDTYDAAFHARVQVNLRWAARWLGVLAVGLAVAGRRLLRASTGDPTSAWARFRTDLSKGVGDLSKRTSATHKRVVLLVLLVGVVLRVVVLFQPVIYDEAFTYVYYAVRPVQVILSDYSYPNNHILHTLLVKLSTSLFGVGASSLRLPALLAGILAMPLFYAFVRAMFNRYIALLALSFVAASGVLIEYSALARGYSLTWMFMLLGWLAGRHFVKTNNSVSAVLVALFNALGMWAVTSMIYIAEATYIWLFLYLIFNYDSSLNRRMYRLIMSVVLFLLFTFLLYTPVIIVHGLGQLFYHPTMGDNTWEHFLSTHQESSFELWAYINDTAATWISVLGFLGLIYAAYISSKFRLLALAILLGALPTVLIQSLVAPPRVWAYTLFIFHLSSGIALFYLLKLLQEVVFKKLAKRFRTVAAALIVLFGMSWLGMRGIQGRLERFPDAEETVRHLQPLLHPEDRLVAEFPFEAPVEFYCLALGVPRQIMYNGPAPNGTLYVVVSPADDQTPEGVMRHYDLLPERFTPPEKVQDRKHSEVWSVHPRAQMQKVVEPDTTGAGMAEDRMP